MPEEKLEEPKVQPKKCHPFSITPSHDEYEEPEPILDATSIQEQMDRGEGMGVDDVKTYHRTEK